MNNELIGVISNEGELEGVIEDNSFNVKVQIMESGPRGLQGNDGYTPVKGVDYFDGEKGEKGDIGPEGPQGDKGDMGDVGPQGPKGDKGDVGPQGEIGPKGEKGDTGPKGEKGEQGPKGDKGDKGESAYEHWLSLGNVGTINDFLLTLKGDKGDKGEQGERGEKGTDGKDGYTPQKGVDYYTDADKAEMVSAVLNVLPVYEGEVESV